MIPVSVIVPVRNAESMIDDCLASITRAEPYEIIVVDGLSTDCTVEIARRYPVKILCDEGKGVPAARRMGIEAATTDYVVLVDVDIVFGEGALEELLDEFIMGQYDALQAGLISISGPGYWGQALAYHHNNGRSKNWPGMMVTIFKRDCLLKNPFDERFRSGEDIELRHRLCKANMKIGVSQETTVKHRFGDTYEFALDQFLQDGNGLGRMVVKYGWEQASVLGIPLAGSIRGILLSLARLKLKYIPYYLVYLVYNYVGIFRGLTAKF